MTTDDGSRDRPVAADSSDERLLVVVSGSRDRELLTNWLADGYEVTTATPGEEWPAFDACLVDAGWYEGVRDRLSDARAAGTAHRPVLLLVPDGRADEPWVDRALDGPVDDVLAVPARKRHLHARLSSLLRARRLSRDLAAERDRFRTLTESANDAIVTVDADGVVRYANPAVEALFGYAPSELRGEPLADLMPERFREAHEAAFTAFLETGERTLDWSTVELTGLHADGHEVPLEVSFATYQSEDGRRFTGILRDITERKRREEQLRLTQRAMDEATVGISIAEAGDDQPLVYVNEAFEDITGYDESAALGRNCRFLQGPETDEAPVAELRRAIEAGEPTTVVLLNYREDGEPFWNEVTVAPVRDGDEVTHFVGFQQDVTERKRLEAELREERELLQELFDTSPVAITVLDPDGNIVRANRAAKDVLRLDPADAVGRTYDAPEWEILDEAGDPVPPEELPFAQVMATGERVTDYEHGIRSPDGEEVWLSISAAPLTDEAGEIRRVVAAMQDVTTRRRQEQELRRTVDLFEQAQDIADIGAWEYDVRDDRLFWSDQMWAIHGFDESFEPTLESVLERYPADERGRIEEQAGEILESGGSLETEIAYETPDGDRRWLHIHAEPRFEDGEPVRLVGTTQDVTARKRQEAELARAFDLLEQAQRLADIGAWEYDVATDELRATDQVYDVHDLPDDFELTIERYFGLFDDERRERLEANWQAVLDTHEPRELEVGYEAPGGEEKWLLFHADPVVEDGVLTAIRGTVQNVTEPLERERDVRRYRTMMQAAANPIYALDAEGRFTHANQEMVDLTDRSREALLGEPAETVFGEDIVTEVNDRIREMLQADERTASFEVTFETADGETRNYRTSLSLLFEDGEYDGTVVVAQDITELRSHERRLSVLDRVFRHNVRNRLNVVAGHLAALVGSDDERAASAARTALAAVDDLQKMTESARRFQQSIRPREASVETADVTTLVADAVASTDHPEATVRTDLPDATSARVPEALPLAIEELVDNAIEHADRDPHIDVTVRETDDAVEVRVADNGPGIPEMTREVVERGAETQLEHTLGLGLWLVRWTVTNAGGTITIEDNEPRGTVVVLRLPRADD